MKMVYVLAVSMFVLGGVYGQSSNDPTNLASLSKIQAGAQGIGFSLEPKVAGKFTIDFSAGVGGGYSIAEGSIDYDILKPAVYLSVTPKFFYNVSQRAKAGKSTRFNSGNYLGICVKYVPPFKRTDDLVRRAVLTNIHWGIQRAIGGHFLFNSHVGVGYAQDIPTKFGTIYPSLDFKFSYVL